MDILLIVACIFPHLCGLEKYSVTRKLSMHNYYLKNHQVRYIWLRRMKLIWLYFSNMKILFSCLTVQLGDKRFISVALRALEGLWKSRSKLGLVRKLFCWVYWQLTLLFSNKIMLTGKYHKSIDTCCELLSVHKSDWLIGRCPFTGRQQSLTLSSWKRVFFLISCLGV